MFHGGVDWRCARALLPRNARLVVKSECPVRAGGRRYVADLKISCARTHRTLLLIEVWHSHAVSSSKRKAFNELGIPWVEVNSWHVLQRFRKRPLPILDWGGAGMPNAPFQGALFEADDRSARRGGTFPMTSSNSRGEPRHAKHGSLDSARNFRILNDNLQDRPQLSI